MNVQIASYNFPVNSSTPFDKNFDGNYFVYANKFSNLGKSIEAFDFETLVKNIPVGYKTIILNHREMLFENGKSLNNWDVQHENVSEEHKSDYILYSAKEIKEFIVDWNRYVITNTIKNTNATSADLKSWMWQNKNECIDFGIEMSIKYNCKIILAKVIKTINWH